MKNVYHILNILFLLSSTCCFSPMIAQSLEGNEKLIQNGDLSICDKIRIHACEDEIQSCQLSKTQMFSDGPIEMKEWFRDNDGDGIGNPFEVAIAYDMPPGYSESSNDVDDTCLSDPKIDMIQTP